MDGYAKCKGKLKEYMCPLTNVNLVIRMNVIKKDYMETDEWTNDVAKGTCKKEHTCICRSLDKVWTHLHIGSM